MNAFRRIRALVLLSFATVAAVSASADSVEAGGGASWHHVHRVPSAPLNYFHGARYCQSVYQPIPNYVVKPRSYVVVLIDSYGQPYVVRPAGYQTLPTTYLP